MMEIISIVSKLRKNVTETAQFVILHISWTLFHLIPSRLCYSYRMYTFLKIILNPPYFQRPSLRFINMRKLLQILSWINVRL